MIEEIRTNLYRIEVPLPDTPLKYLNSYVIRSQTRHLVIDTGFDIKECEDAMRTGLKSLDIDPERTDYFITHLHMDHFGLVKRLAARSSKIYFNAPDAEIMRNWKGWPPLVAFAGRHGFPQADIKNAIEKNIRHKLDDGLAEGLTLLKDGDSIHADNYQFRCVQTPGHSYGHLCLYEQGHKLLIAGDHILADISPTIQCWTDEHNPLRHYLRSLDKVYELDIDLVLPGHRNLIFDHKARISELKAHHENRCNEIIEILEAGPLSAYEVAAKMTWSIRGDSWQTYPLAQKWFAMGEAVSHLRYMEEKGRLMRLEKNGRYRYAVIV